MRATSPASEMLAELHAIFHVCVLGDGFRLNLFRFSVLYIRIQIVAVLKPLSYLLIAAGVKFRRTVERVVILAPMLGCRLSVL